MNERRIKQVTPETLGKEVRLIAQGVLDVGEIALNAWKKGGIKVSQKGFQEGIVTQQDLDLNGVLINYLKALFPGERIMAEESFNEAVDFGDTFHAVDPIDGTYHFARGLYDWSIVYAHISKNIVDTAVIFAPATGEIFVGKLGHGAYKNGRRMSVSNRDRSELGIQVGQDTVRFFGRTDIEMRAAKKTQMLWITGSTNLALSRLADGQIELAININQPTWDFAAGKLLVEEAGGRISNFDGTHTFDYSGKKTNSFIASNGRHHNLGLWIANGTVLLA